MWNLGASTLNTELTLWYWTWTSKCKQAVFCSGMGAGWNGMWLFGNLMASWNIVARWVTATKWISIAKKKKKANCRHQGFETLPEVFFVFYCNVNLFLWCMHSTISYLKTKISLMHARCFFLENCQLTVTAAEFSKNWWNFPWTGANMELW